MQRPGGPQFQRPWWRLALSLVGLGFSEPGGAEFQRAWGREGLTGQREDRAKTEVELRWTQLRLVLASARTDLEICSRPIHGRGAGGLRALAPGWGSRARWQNRMAGLKPPKLLDPVNLLLPVQPPKPLRQLKPLNRFNPHIPVQRLIKPLEPLKPLKALSPHNRAGAAATAAAAPARRSVATADPDAPAAGAGSRDL